MKDQTYESVIGDQTLRLLFGSSVNGSEVLGHTTGVKAAKIRFLFTLYSETGLEFVDLGDSLSLFEPVVCEETGYSCMKRRTYC